MSVNSTQSATLANVASSASSVTILAAGGARKAWSVFNDSTATLYLAFTATAASSSNFTVKVGPGAYFECAQPVYGGAVTGIWDAANGNARVTSW